MLSNYSVVPLYFFLPGRLWPFFPPCFILHPFSAASPSPSFHSALTLSTGISTSLFYIGLRFSGPGHRPRNMVLTPLPSSPTPGPPSLEFGHCILVYRSYPPLISTLSVFLPFWSSSSSNRDERGKMLTHCPAMIGNVEHIRYVLRRKSN